jgi:very-short-patch-repair endonuclease
VLSYADHLRKNQTATEKRFASFLDQVDGGKWRGQYRCQHAFSGKWIADFYIPRVRLVIEIDGLSHQSRMQGEKDQLKTRDALNLDLSIVRFSNEDVWRNLSAVTNGLLKAVDEAECRILTTLSPYGLRYSSHSTPTTSRRNGLTRKSSKAEWENLPDYSPRIPTPDESMTEKYRHMKFSDASAISGLELIRQCLNPKCNYETVSDLRRAIEEKSVQPGWTADSLEAKSSCSKCRSKFVLVRLGKLR